MKKINIISDKIKSLRQVSLNVTTPLSKDDEDILLSMLDYLKKSQDEEYAEKHELREGVGLAAPQIARNKQMIAVYFEDPKDNKTYEYMLVNPRVVSNSVRLCYLENGEGCLSVLEEHKGFVYRPFKITVRAYDAKAKKEIELKLKGFPSIVFQHEIDHLSGVLFYDHIDKKNPFHKIDDAIMI